MSSSTLTINGEVFDLTPAQLDEVRQALENAVRGRGTTLLQVGPDDLCAVLIGPGIPVTLRVGVDTDVDVPTIDGVRLG